MSNLCSSGLSEEYYVDKIICLLQRFIFLSQRRSAPFPLHYKVYSVDVGRSWGTAYTECIPYYADVLGFFGDSVVRGSTEVLQHCYT